ncbi:ORC ubiquitin ligase 1 [Biomphalaria glabrata]|nr:putative serine/threonine-protein kinase nek3 isoform X3 [Biomphalaria glabrata]
MASDNKTRLNKHSTVTFTLPISCQICLGKVKKPVLCPNLHVFCQLCLDIWLKRNNQCPTCRVNIGADNPVKHIIGGQVEDEIPDNQSTPELRRIRFDLLYHEYEDQFEKMRKEIIILKTENNILSAQLGDAEVEINNHRQGSSVQSNLIVKKSHQEADVANLLALTKNLQEAQKLYADIKSEMAYLKKENSKLKDENISLTQENQTLRLELAQRSPKKFGRFTVATLETKIAEQDKEIRQLKMALERSDSYIEELEQQLKKYNREDKVLGNNKKRNDVNNKSDNYSVNLWPSSSKSKPDSAAYNVTVSQDSAKKVLFGSSKLVNTKEHNNIRSTDQSTAKCLTDLDMASKNILKSAKSSDYMEDSPPPKTERTPKKVQFNVSTVEEQSNAVSSFELELPSPLDKSSHLRSRTKSINTDKTVEGMKPQEDFSSKSDEEFQKRIANLLKINSYQTDLVTTSEMEVKKSNVRTAEIKAPKLTGNHADQSKDSSHLSIPEPGSFDHLLGSGNLDYSMTPEMTDCIELMNRAEKNVNFPASVSQSLSITKESTNVAQHASTISIASQNSLAPIYYPPLYAAPPSQYSSLPNQGSLWQHQFYSSLRSNPYPLTSLTHSQAPMNHTQQMPQSSLYKTTDSKVAGIKDSLSERVISSRDFHFSEPVQVVKDLTSLPNPVSSSLHFRFSEPTPYFTSSLNTPHPLSNMQTAANSVIFSSSSYSKPSVTMTRTANLHFVSGLPLKSQPTSSSTPNLTMLGLNTTERPPSSSIHGVGTVSHYKGSGMTYPSLLLDSILSPSLNSSQLNWPTESHGPEDTPSSLTSTKLKPSDNSLGADTDFSMSSTSP